MTKFELFGIRDYEIDTLDPTTVSVTSLTTPMTSLSYWMFTESLENFTHVGYTLGPVMRVSHESDGFNLTWASKLPMGQILLLTVLY
jgi:hypothetical protein